MQTLASLMQDERYQKALREAKARRANPPKPAPYEAPEKPIHQYTPEELLEAAAHCGYCRGMGYVPGDDLPPTHEDFGKVRHCPACRKYRDEQRRRKILDNMGDIIQRYSMLKGELLNCTFANYDRTIQVNDNPVTADVWTAVRGWAGDVYNGRRGLPWLYLHGPTGNGKTHLAAAAANGLTSTSIAVVFTTFTELLGMVSSNGYEDRERVIRALTRIPALIIDDVRGEELVHGWASSILFRILDSRYVTRAATMIVSNLPVTAYRNEPAIADFEPRIASRIQDTSLCRIVANIAPDYRTGRAAPTAD